MNILSHMIRWFYTYYWSSSMVIDAYPCKLKLVTSGIVYSFQSKFYELLEYLVGFVYIIGLLICPK